MTLSEKIIYSRKKAMLSQEALAEKLGVSRQAISKWETGESVPEVGNLSALATALGVTVDWLLSPDEPKTNTSTVNETTNLDWIDKLPGFLSKAFRRYGWICGIVVSVIGLFIALYGIIARSMLLKAATDPFTGELDREVLAFFSNVSPIYTISIIMLIAGALFIIAGIALAVILKKRNKNKE